MGDDESAAPVAFRRVGEGDFPVLGRWLAEPHVARWWNHETSMEAVARDFGASARGEEPSEDFLALVDGRAVGLVQRCRIADYAEDFAPIAALTEVPEGAAMLDYLIGAVADTGRGLGPAMVRAATDLVWRDFPDAPCVVIPVVAGNRASWRCLEKAGYRRVAEGEMEPDNPVDPPLHFVYRIDRPDR
ncbi:aminoglycoside 6'-N-acetyltransferase [Actinocorallia herbida]|uniref:Aminoglycoside 6'-N-acetyltransferase n=1 Tax=Actinocorallia herbida TaxID=58109 RepID=A0A3N1CUQ5_9ACTN|nr:GNAT family N-acetyltransferase [Actinocorallia herbida]ROO84965.1 aminoglycoside 6'-N-acetyltransferase [Actinocorallia herbida]